MEYADLEPFDHQILTPPQEDCRIAFCEVARIQSVFDDTVSRQYHAVVQDGLLKVLATGDPNKIGNRVGARSLIKTLQRAPEVLARALAVCIVMRLIALATGQASTTRLTGCPNLSPPNFLKS